MKDTTPFEFDEKFSTANGHAYFRCSIGRMRGRWAIADSSGHAPWATDDGVLWVIPNQSIELGGRLIALMIEGPDGPTRTIIGPAEALLVAARLGLSMKVPGSDRAYTVVATDEPVNDGGTGNASTLARVNEQERGAGRSFLEGAQDRRKGAANA